MAGNPGSAPPTKVNKEGGLKSAARAHEDIKKVWRQVFPGKTTVQDIRSASASHQEIFAEASGDGVYVCHRCATPLYDEKDRIPSEGDVKLACFSSSLVTMDTCTDRSFGLRNVALRCPTCGLFVGDLFNDKVHEKRHCLFSIALAFIDAETGEVTYGTDATPVEEESGFSWLYVAIPVSLAVVGSVAAYFMLKPKDNGDSSE